MEEKTDYLKKYGKLTKTLGVPIDLEMHDEIMRIKEAGFDFNAYVRDMLKASLEQASQIFAQPKNQKEN